MPPSAKPPPSLRGILLSRGAVRPGHHYSVVPRYGHLSTQQPSFAHQYHHQNCLSTSHWDTTTRALRLAEPFLFLFRQLDFAPTLRGARLALTGPSSVTRHGERFHHHSLHDANRAALRHLAAFSRQASRPAFGMLRSPVYGPGLQPARNFSLGPPKFAYLIANAPLSLRAGGDELRDNLKQDNTKTEACGPRLSPRRIASLTEAQQNSTLIRVSPEAKAFTLDQASSTKEANAPVRRHQFADNTTSAREYDLHFPEVPIKRDVVSSVLTEMVIPMEPDVYNILAHGASFDKDNGDRLHLLDSRLRESKQQIVDAYHVYKLRLRTVLRLCEDLEADTPHLGQRRLVRDSGLEFMPDTAHHVGYKVHIRGYSAEQLKELLIERLGLSHGEWFGQLIRDVTPQNQNDGSLFGVEKRGIPQNEICYTGLSNDALDLAGSPALSSELDADDIELVSSCSEFESQSLLLSPPLSFSATFSSMMEAPNSWSAQSQRDADWLQNSCN